MAQVQEKIGVNEIVALAQKLTWEDQQLLALRIEDLVKSERRKALIEIADQRELTHEEWQEFFELNIVHRVGVADFSPRREDWYSDDGR